jgi:hypothetical protein
MLDASYLGQFWRRSRARTPVLARDALVPTLASPLARPSVCRHTSARTGTNYIEEIAHRAWQIWLQTCRDSQNNVNLDLHLDTNNRLYFSIFIAGINKS